MSASKVYKMLEKISRNQAFSKSQVRMEFLISEFLERIIALDQII
jgi:hypothetical protein